MGGSIHSLGRSLLLPVRTESEGTATRESWRAWRWSRTPPGWAAARWLWPGSCTPSPSVPIHGRSSSRRTALVSLSFVDPLLPPPPLPPTTSAVLVSTSSSLPSDRLSLFYRLRLSFPFSCLSIDRWSWNDGGRCGAHHLCSSISSISRWRDGRMNTELSGKRAPGCKLSVIYIAPSDNSNSQITNIRDSLASRPSDCVNIPNFSLVVEMENIAKIVIARTYTINVIQTKCLYQ